MSDQNTPPLEQLPVLRTAQARRLAGDPETLFQAATRLSAEPTAKLPGFLQQAVAGAAAADAARNEIAADSDLDYRRVNELRATTSELLAKRIGDQIELGSDDARQLGISIIQELLNEEAAERLSRGDKVWSPGYQTRMQTAVYDAVFRAGRLQPLLDDDSIENIMITGWQQVRVQRIDGTSEMVPPITSSDVELIEMVQWLASRSTVGERSFSPKQPALDMRLDDGSRLAAVAWVTPYPVIVIRRHRLRHVSLTDLVRLGTLTPVMASFLAACVRSKATITVAGEQGAGKTTLLRALCAEIPRHEVVGTFETEYELLLHEMGTHDVVVPWEERQGSGELDPDGSRSGEFNLDQALYHSFRYNLSRYVVGEIRGAEAWTLLRAMESGAGSLSTTHAPDAFGIFDKLVSCAMMAPNVSAELAAVKVASALQILVHVRLVDLPASGGRPAQRRRFVSEIVLLQGRGEQLLVPQRTVVFKFNPDGPGTPNILPDDWRERLEPFGFDVDAFLGSHGHIAGGEEL